MQEDIDIKPEDVVITLGAGTVTHIDPSIVELMKG